MKKLILIILTLCAIAYLSGCMSASERKLHRAKRLIAEAVALGAKVNQDTLKKVETDTLKGATADVVIPWITDEHVDLSTGELLYDDSVVHVPVKVLHDTVFGKGGIRFIIKHDTLRVECPDAISTTTTNEVATTEINCPPQDHTWRYIGIGALVFSLLMLLLAATLGGKLLQKQKN